MSQAEDFAARFNALEYAEGSALATLDFYESLEEASASFVPDGAAFNMDTASVKCPAIIIFGDSHLSGAWTFADGSSLRIARTDASAMPQASTTL